MKFYENAADIYADLKLLVANTKGEFIAIGVSFDRSVKHHSSLIEKAIERGVLFRYVALSRYADFGFYCEQFDQTYDELKSEVDSSCAVLDKMSKKYRESFTVTYTKRCSPYRIYIADPYASISPAIIVFYGLSTDSPLMPAFKVDNIKESPFANYYNDAIRALSKDENKKVFIIHGHNEAKWRELEKILNKLHLEPIILGENPDHGATTIIEKFEHYASQCVYAIAVFTPDDQVEKNGKMYLQARPNVMFEVGWFCGRL